MPVQTIEADIELATDEPLGERLLPLQDPLPPFEPDQFLLGPFGPEPVGRGDRFLVELAVLRQGSEMGGFDEAPGGPEKALFVEDGFNIRPGLS